LEEFCLLTFDVAAWALGGRRRQMPVGIVVRQIFPMAGEALIAAPPEVSL
jgi:hypothetical protein